VDRRAFLGALTGSLLAAPLAAEAQQPVRVARIGVLSPGDPLSEPSPRFEAFRRELRERGWVEGQNIAIEWRFAEGKNDRLPDLAAELIRLKAVSDPVGQGLVASLARPGGNVTGLATFFPELAAKRLALLKETLPRVSRVAVLRNPANPANVIIWKEVQVAARTLGVTLQSREVRGPDDFEGAFAAMTKERPEALLTLDDPLVFQYQTSIVAFAAEKRLPAMHAFRESVEVGGLMSYGANLPDLFRRAAALVDKILKGARPADLPIEQPTNFELVINLKTAKALGLTIPPSLLRRADQVIA